MFSPGSQDESKLPPTTAACRLSDNTMSQHSHSRIIEMTNTSQVSDVDNCEVSPQSVEDDPASKLAGDGLPLSSHMAPELRDLVSEALDKLYEHTISLVHPTSKETVCVSCPSPPIISLKLGVIQETVTDGGLMDTDSLNLAIRKMPREKSSNGDSNNSRPLCCKHYVSADFGMYATSVEAGDSSLENFTDNEFVGLYDSEGSNIEVICVPVILHNHWTLYAFNIKEVMLSILDSKENHSRHEGIPLKIGKALDMALAKVGCNYSFSNWNHRFHEVEQQKEGSNDCGFFVFNFMRHWDGHELVGFPSATKKFRKEFLAYVLSFDDDEAHGLPNSLDRLIQKLPSGPQVHGQVVALNCTTSQSQVMKRCRDNASPLQKYASKEVATASNRSPVEIVAEEHTQELESVIEEIVNHMPPLSVYDINPLPHNSEATITNVPSTTRGIDGTKPPMYKVAPVTKIIMEPCKTLKSPFLIKRQSLRRPDARIVEDLYQYTIKNTLPIWQRTGDLQKIMNCGERMDTVCLNLTVSNMGKQDAQDFRNTKCLGWRHYVDSGWAIKSLSGYSNPVDLKNLFYRGSVLYNASRSHMVFIPVVHGYHWSLYAFNMCDQKLSILDSLPDATKGVDDPAERHEKIRCKLCDALTVTMNCAIDFRSWEYKFPKVPRQLKRCDSGFFVFNFMRLWDGHQLVRWFPTESRELRKDFLAYILAWKDNNIHLPNEISSKIKDLPGKMMDCTMQKFAREGTTLCTENQEDDGGVGSSNNVSSAHVVVRNDDDLEASIERSHEHICFSKFVEWNIYLFKLCWNLSREAVAVMSSASVPASASSDFLDTCHRVTSDGDGLLHIAARFENVDLVKAIWGHDKTLAAVLLSAVNNRGDTTLHCAAAGRSDVIVKFFLEDMMGENWDPLIISKFLRAQNLKGETCLHEAVRHGRAKIVETLLWKDKVIVDLSIEDLKGPTLVQIVDNEGISPLYLATTLRNIEIVQGLTKCPYNHYKYAPSCSGPAGKTALHAAVVLLHKGLVKLLLKWKAGLTSQVDESGSTPLHYLASLSLERREPNSIVQLLYSLLHFFNYLRKCHCCKPAQDSGIVELIMKEDPLAPLYADSTGSLPIHIAAAHGRLDILQKLLQECPYCDSSRNASGQTFLHVAVEKEKLEIVRYVCGAKKFNRILNAVDQDWNTALHLAILNSSEESINNASEKIFCTLMRNRDVCLNFANNEGHTPLDLAFLSLHPEVISMKGHREWIFFDLLHGGGDFGVGGWDRLVGDLVKPDWEKESERVGKSASMLALSVLILNASFLVPFRVVSSMDKWGVDPDKQGVAPILFQLFVILDSIAFVCSVMATYFCASAGFAMLDGRTRLKNLMTGTFYVTISAPAVILAVALALFLELPLRSLFLPIIVAGFGILIPFIYGFFKSKIAHIGSHLQAVDARVGTFRLACILLFQRSAVKPLWVVPSPSIGLFLFAVFFAVVYSIVSFIVNLLSM